MRPYLLELARTQSAHQGPPFRYDDTLDQLLVEFEGTWIPAIDAPTASPMTKKKDIEKGEDSKDRW